MYGNPQAIQGLRAGRYADGAVLVFDLLTGDTKDNYVGCRVIALPTPGVSPGLLANRGSGDAFDRGSWFTGGRMTRKPKHPIFSSHDPLLDASLAATLDLHGFTGAEASAAVRRLLETWRRSQPSAVVHIITGKGKGSAGAPVLRGLVKTLLKGELREFVTEWSRDDADGGYKVRVR